jgi:cytoskeletal protein CcmA (bactofilin family)
MIDANNLVHDMLKNWFFVLVPALFYSSAVQCQVANDRQEVSVSASTSKAVKTTKLRLELSLGAQSLGNERQEVSVSASTSKAMETKLRRELSLGEQSLSKMIAANYLALAAFMVTCSTILILPFVPAYREWKHPSDSAALPISANYASDIDHFARRLHADVMAKLGLGNKTGYEDFDFAPTPLEKMQWAKAQKRLISRSSIETSMSIDSPQSLYVEGSIKTGADSVFSALYATGDIELGARSKILNWAHSEGVVRLSANSVTARRISAGSMIALGESVLFERLNAPSVQFGSSINNKINSYPNRPEQSPTNLADVPNAKQQTPSLYFVQGDCELAADAIYHGTLIVTGVLTIGTRTTVIGDIKARKGLLIKEGASVQGAVTCEKYIHVFSDAFVLGPLLSERGIELDLNAVIGLPDAPTTVSARNIFVNNGVIVHGSIWAHDKGMVRPT